MADRTPLKIKNNRITQFETSDSLGLVFGGTGTDLSLTGGVGQFLRQSSAGAAITVSAIAHADLGSGGGTGSKYLRDDMTWQATSAFAAASHAHAASDITSGTLVLERGGTEADLSATGPGALVQTSAGAAVTVETLDETRGGTAQTTYATGDVLYASGTDTLARLAVGTDGHVLTLASGVPTWAAAAAGVTDHGALTGLGDDDHTQYALLAGRSGGQTLIGGTASGDDLTLQSTSHATKGNIFFGTGGTNTFDEVNGRWGFGVAAPARALEVRSTSAQQRWSYDATYYWEISVASGDHLTISHPSRSNYAGDILIGSNVTGLGGSSNPAIAIGNNSTASAVNTIALGKNASATTSNGGIAIGPDTITTGSPTGSIAIGGAAISRSVNAPGVAIGAQAALNNAGAAVGGGVLVGAWTAAAVGYAIAIGTGAQVTGTGGIAIGCDQATAGNSTIAPANTMVCGSVGYPCANVFWGKGRTTHATPTAVTLNGTGGSGTNIAGGALQIAGGKGTGNAAGGSVKIQASTAGASGTTLQTLATVAEFGPATIGFYGVTPVARPAAYTQTYSTADRTLSAYTADDESVAYTGAGDGEAQLADLNALRTAYENLRAFVEDIAQMLNSVTDDLQAVGLLQ